jgi:hypothetical protein
MAIKKRIEEALEKNREFVAKDPRELSMFIEDLKRCGLVVKKEYDLPPLDTIGKHVYREKSQNCS